MEIIGKLLAAIGGWTFIRNDLEAAQGFVDWDCIQGSDISHVSTGGGATTHYPRACLHHQPSPLHRPGWIPPLIMVAFVACDMHR